MTERALRGASHGGDVILSAHRTPEVEQHTAPTREVTLARCVVPRRVAVLDDVTWTRELRAGGGRAPRHSDWEGGGGGTLGYTFTQKNNNKNTHCKSKQ